MIQIKDQQTKTDFIFHRKKHTHESRFDTDPLQLCLVIWIVALMTSLSLT
jgi:hypothetical protein